MYIAYGWPKVLLTGSSTSALEIVYLKAQNGLLLLVSSSHMEVWSTSQHKIRLGLCNREPTSMQVEGYNLQAIWSADTKTILVLTSARCILCYELSASDKQIRFGGKESSGLFLMNLKLLSSLKAPFPDDVTSMSNFAASSDSVILGLSNGVLHLISWSGEFLDSVNLVKEGGSSSGLSARKCNGDLTYPAESVPSYIDPSTALDFVQLEVSMQLYLFVAVFQDGHVSLFSTSKNGVKKACDIVFERWVGISDAVCASIAHVQNMLAIGSKNGAISLFDLADNATLVRTISLYDWGYSMEDTGAVSCISWTPDNNAFTVGWQLRGLAVWSSSGCRLMCTIRQSGLNSAFSPVVKSGQTVLRCEPLSGGVTCLDWDDHAYQLYAVESRNASRIFAFSFGKCCLNRGVSGVSHFQQLICCEDRVLLLQSEDEDELKIQHLVVPQSYIGQNWPVSQVAASKDGTHLAIAGQRGLIIYDLRSKKWRVFGDVMQEQRINCKGLLWLGRIVVVCNYNEGSTLYELCFYPRYHLDESSLLCRKTLVDQPIVMDIWQDYILVTYAPFDVHVFHARLSGKLSPAKTPTLQLVTARELSIMTAKKQPVAMRFLPHRLAQDGKLSSEVDISLSDDAATSLDYFSKQPTRCLILRINGELSLLDLDEGSECKLTSDIEHFWVTCKQPEGEANLIEEVSWLAYGHHGMQAWYPSSGADPYQQQDFLQLDPELEFDREVYPLGLLPYSGVVVGVSQRLSFSAGVDMPCFEPLPQAQTILHCLLRHLLQRGKMNDALQLARLSAGRPHFSHCLEWLLFTVFDAVVSSQNAGKPEFQGPIKWNPSILLEQACDLIRNFSEYLDVVVSVARKTDGRHWSDLFAAAGKSTELFDECFKRRCYRTAACYILVIEKLEGTPVSQYNALRLLQATLEESMYELAGELVRFLLRSGREVEVINGEPERKANSFLGSFLFRTSQVKEAPTNLQTSKSFAATKETNAHVATVKRILENHAGYLMANKMLRELVTFVKGTQFDLTEFLQSPAGKSARLHDFASALHIVGQKLHMNVLQSRLDAEFLLAHMCTVGFKEWIVVLATLLRRVEVLLDLFRGDRRLWNAYSQTLRLQAEFSEYEDLLYTIDEALESDE